MRTIQALAILIGLALIAEVTRATPLSERRDGDFASVQAGGTGKQLTSDEDQREIDQRLEELLDLPPDVVALMLDQEGRLVARLDVMVGGAGLQDPEELTDILSGIKIKDRRTSPNDSGDCRLMIVPGAPMVNTPPSGAFFDPDKDLAVAVRVEEPDHSFIGSCYGYVSLYLTQYGREGKSYYWYWFKSDGISAVVGPNRGKTTDPDLYLYYYKNGDVLLDSSTRGDTIDDVAGYNSGCVAQSWKVRVKMYSGGYYSLAVHTWLAN
ncbi:MAG: hypothetical protein AB1486_15145 [Planctomycetota bacterium]